MKYEFTGETKIEFGVKLHRIRALVAIAAIGVAMGDLGGWIEKESNLSRVSGDAWVYGDAQVYGGAWVSGDARVSRPVTMATRSDGATAIIVPDQDGNPVIIGGCHYFTIPEARKYWNSRPGSKQLRDESIAIGEHLERMAIIQGWHK